MISDIISSMMVGGDTKGLPFFVRKLIFPLMREKQDFSLRPPRYKSRKKQKLYQRDDILNANQKNLISILKKVKQIIHKKLRFLNFPIKNSQRISTPQLNALLRVHLEPIA